MLAREGNALGQNKSLSDNQCGRWPALAEYHMRSINNEQMSCKRSLLLVSSIIFFVYVSEFHATPTIPDPLRTRIST